LKVIFAGGGTAGHIYPAVAIARYISQEAPDSKFLFIGTKQGLEKELVTAEGFDITFIDVVGFKRSISIKNISAVAKTVIAYIQSKKIIKKFAPDIVIGTGGYVSGPVVAAAVRQRVPTLIHEQNALPGLTSKLLGNIADVVCISFLQSKYAFKNAKKLIFTGNPLRPELFTVKKEEARQFLGLDYRPFIVAFGGSLGAKRLNEALISFIANSSNTHNIQMLFATGKAQYKEISDVIESKGILDNKNSNIKIVPYINNMEYVLNAADLVISRAGAVAVSEITALGKPAILIPSPNVTHNHQEHNARVLEQAGAAIVITEKELSDELLSKTINNLIFDKKSLEQMVENSASLGAIDATQKIYQAICELILLS
jgi:UDP-N-acetylglucosamine--N-acetylmuramyl-(pentapeptide) pyrophosphoryl-undecaprenol N-acetylglucosamine transferase